jgi:hypothetical protein
LRLLAGRALRPFSRKIIVEKLAKKILAALRLREKKIIVEKLAKKEALLVCE